MPLDPQVQALRERLVAANARPLYTMSLAEARAADLAANQESGGTPEPVAQVIDQQVSGTGGSIPIRIYRPDADGPLPILVYFFGGGWTLGTLDTCDAICRRLTNSVSCITVAVGYRLAPEHVFPAAVDDCYEATVRIAELAGSFGGDASRIAVGGDSAGGNLAASVTLRARELSAPSLTAQLLVYPNTDFHADTPSRRDNTDLVFFNNRSINWYWGHYLADPADGAHPYASPLRAEDLSGLPPALVITAEYDPLRDEGEQYAERLADSGTPAQLTRYEGMIHGFFAMAGMLDAGGRALDEAAEFLRGRFAADHQPGQVADEHPGGQVAADHPGGQVAADHPGGRVAAADR